MNLEKIESSFYEEIFGFKSHGRWFSQPLNECKNLANKFHFVVIYRRWCDKKGRYRIEIFSVKNRRTNRWLQGKIAQLHYERYLKMNANREERSRIKAPKNFEDFCWWDLPDYVWKKVNSKQKLFFKDKTFGVPKVNQPCKSKTKKSKEVF